MALTLDQVKVKSAARLERLQSIVKAAAEALIERCYARGVQIIITQGLRTIAEQDALFAQGRTQAELNVVGLSHVKAQPSKPKVTNARGGYSNHNFGWAIDFALLLPDGRTVSWDTLRDDDKDSLPDWSEVVEEAKRLGFEWGGDWRSFLDLPHLQMVFGLTTTQLRIGRQPTAAQIAAVERNLYNTTEAIKGDDILELTKYQWDALKNNVEALLKAGTISDKAWLTKISEKTLTVSELAWLSFILTTK
ncbi:MULTISPECIES: M15 family metallopeptidase [unclassified Paenibacillus]|uniref:M15 family metallopeptidase n=1 Tax=unclassified Paenibacillus TaxID=185978 RepID=UPI002405CDCA|nr:MULTISPECIES: M15 family metallopeptidase [unclassified Paenibacillus]